MVSTRFAKNSSQKQYFCPPYRYKFKTLFNLNCPKQAPYSVQSLPNAGLLLSSPLLFFPSPSLPKKYFFYFDGPNILYAILSCVWITIRISAYTSFGSYFDSVARPGSPTLAKTNTILRCCAPRAFTYGPKNFGKLALASLAVRCAHSRVFLKFIQPISSALVSQHLKLRLFSLALRWPGPHTCRSAACPGVSAKGSLLIHPHPTLIPQTDSAQKNQTAFFFLPKLFFFPYNKYCQGEVSPWDPSIRTIKKSNRILI